MSFRTLCWLICIFGSTSVFANSAPSLELSPHSGVVGNPIVFVVAPSDPDGVVPGVFLKSGPAGATLDDNGDGTRTFRWNPSSAGTVSVEFTVTDGQDSTLKRMVTTTLSIVGSSSSSQTAPAAVDIAISPLPDSGDAPSEISVSGGTVDVEATGIGAPAAIHETELPPADVSVSADLPAPSATRVIGNELPEFAQKYAEVVSSAEITRISDRSNFESAGADISHQYSKRRVWNSNQTLLDIENSIIDAQSYAVVIGAVPLSKERVWSHLQPNLMYGMKVAAGRLNQLASYNVVTGQIETVFHFVDFQNCSLGQWEGDITADDRYVLVTCRYEANGAPTAISVDMQQKSIVGTLVLDADFNWGGFSLSGKHVVIEYAQPWSSNYRSVRYSPQLTNPLQLASHVYHGDFGRDETGADFYALINDQGIHYYLLHDGSRVNIGASSEGLGLGDGHLSCRSTQRAGWCYFSSSSHSNIGAVRMAIDTTVPVGQQSNGRPLYQGVKQFELWGLSRSSSNRYLATPRASVSPDGTKAIFASDWFGSSGVHTYLLNKTQ